MKPFVPLLLALCVAGPAVAAEKVDFNRVRSILSNNCFQCHGPDEDERQGGTDGVRLDTAEGAYADQDGHAAVVPGKPELSELVRRINTQDADERMPPAESGKKLSADEIQLLTEWIRQGGKYGRHWSYEKPIRPDLPAIRQKSWPRNEIDHFLLARLEREGLKPAAKADRAALIRRVSLDLTGLPPTLEEVEQFLADQRPDAYEALVDRLLAKETFGEHWARMWLDLARYADSAGYADDPPRTIWGYRDYVIRSINANKPFDQFTVEQLAGDLLPNPTQEQLIATGFHRNTLTNNEGGTNDEEFRNVAIVDRVNTTLAVWMGTTMACAQCHSHKFDPITQEEYFRVFAILNSTQDADRRDESPYLEIYSPRQKQQKLDWQNEIAQLEKLLGVHTPALAQSQLAWEARFATEPAWQTLRPAEARSKSGAGIQLADDGAVRVASKEKQDSYTLDVPLAGGKLAALRLETLPDDALPGKGAGYGGGNFVISRVTATLVPPESTSLSGRYVRVEIPGKSKILSLAEVQVYAAAENLARSGRAKQSSTAYEGPAKYAIDGNTSGVYTDKSTTHTAQSDNPWWELDLQQAKPIDRIVLWNRTDGNLESRLSNFRLAVLNENREVLWEQQVKPAPNPSAEFSVTGARQVPFTAAFADYSQPNFAAESIVNNQDVANLGWAVGGQIDRPHQLILTPRQPLDLEAGWKLSIQIDQLSKHENHTLGRFRLSTTADARAIEYSRTPGDVRELLKISADRRNDAQRDRLAAYYRSVAPELKQPRDQLEKLTKQLADMKPTTTVPILRELPEGKQRKTHVQRRGNFLDTMQEVTPGVPAAFHPLKTSQPPTRLDLAKWLIDKDNPLTARVIVNRYWEQIFGVGIVRSSEEFGSQGEFPTHPELLDWLATELMRQGWDTRHLVRLMVTSAAYRQSSRVTPELLAKDPDNLLLARGPRFRLSAEMIRDQALFVAGLLSDKMYGPPVKPPQPNLGVNAAFGGKIDWETSQGDDRYRRAFYTTWRRSNPYPSMATFDAPNREVCTIRRDRTNTPLQALVTLNDPVYVEAAQALARRMAAQEGTSQDKARYGFRLCLARQPSDQELSHLVRLFEQATARFAQNADAAMQMATQPLGPPPEGANLPELAAWTVVGNVMLNLDEMFMKR